MDRNIFFYWVDKIKDGFAQYDMAFTKQTQFANNNNVNPASEF